MLRTGCIDIRSGHLYDDGLAARQAGVPDDFLVSVAGTEAGVHRVALACVLEARRQRRLRARRG